MIYIAIWLWLVGAFMAWGDLRAEAGPDPASIYFHALVAAFWPVLMTLGLCMTVVVTISVKT